MARYLGEVVDTGKLTHRNWTLQIPIFPCLHDLERLLWLLSDSVLLDPKVLPVFLLSHGGAIMNRLRFVAPPQWTDSATTQVVEYGAAKTISAVAWAAWFGVTVPRGAQCAAVQAVDRLLGARPHANQNRWVTLLHIHTRMIRHWCPGPRADTLARLISDNAAAVDVEQLLHDWVVFPTTDVRAQIQRWAGAAHGHPFADTPALFVLAQLRHAHQEFVPVPSQPPASVGSGGVSGPVADHLVELASSECVTNAPDAFWFVVHYACDAVLVALAERWSTNLRDRLVKLSADDSHNAQLFDTNWYLDKRCGMLEPRNVALDCLCLGLHMVMKRDIEVDASSLLTAGDNIRMEQLITRLGGGDRCHFLFVQTTCLGRWRAWAALVAGDTPAWRRFVSTAGNGRVAAGNVFRRFPIVPVDDPERSAWRQTRAAMPRFSIATLGAAPRRCIHAHTP